MAWQGMATEFLQVPAVTRTYTAACVLTTAAVVSRAGGWVSPWLQPWGCHGYGWTTPPPPPPPAGGQFLTPPGSAAAGTPQPFPALL